MGKKPQQSNPHKSTSSTETEARKLEKLSAELKIQLSQNRERKTFNCNHINKPQKSQNTAVGSSSSSQHCVPAHVETTKLNLCRPKPNPTNITQQSQALLQQHQALECDSFMNETFR